MRAPPPTLRHAPVSRRARRIALCIVASLPLAIGSAASAQELAPLPGLAAGGALDRTAEDLVRTQWSVEPQPSFPGRATRLTLSVYVDDAFLEASMVQPFTRRLDLPVAIDELQVAGVELGNWGMDLEASGGVLLALGGRLVRAESLDSVQLDGREWRGARLTTAVTPERAGSFALPAPVVRFAAAEHFREELLGRTPLDPRLAFARGTESAWVVRPFPEAGRDPDFAEILGTYRLAAEVNEPSPRLGDVIELTVIVEGPPLEEHALPRLDRMRGLHLVAQSVTRGADSTELRAELRVERGTVREIPPIVLHSFDPAAEQYVTASSAAIPLRVLVPAEADRDAEPERTPARWLVWPLVLAGAGLGYLLHRRARSKR